jgi:hypothetical protein
MWHTWERRVYNIVNLRSDIPCLCGSLVVLINNADTLTDVSLVMKLLTHQC